MRLCGRNRHFLRYLIVSLLSRFLQLLAQDDAVLVTVHSTRGSVPRETGAWLAVFAQETVATVGGGRLELDAIAHARQGHWSAGDEVVRYPLGPSLGQCCGGEVHLRFEHVSAVDIPALRARLTDQHVPVALFGGGHVGQALIAVLGQLPMAVTWIDSRDEIFPLEVPANVQCEHSDPVQSAVAQLQPGSRALIMSFSHAEDLDIVAACLARQRAQGDLPYVGLIGSNTKWASFRQRLQARGFSDAELAHITCPIGIPGIADKRPEVIAVAVAAQLLLLP
jgi:xanthine dehydrogenase accessory factor